LYHLGMELPVPINAAEFILMHSLEVALYLSIPLTYGVRKMVDRFASNKQSATETRQSS